MELADDISYGVHDLEDAIVLKRISYNSLIDHFSIFSKELLTHKIAQKYSLKKALTDLCSDEKPERKRATGALVNYFVSSSALHSNDIFECPLLRINTILHSDASHILSLLKSFIRENVILTPETQIIEKKGQDMIVEIFNALKDNPKRLLKRSTIEKASDSTSIKRVICDHISGMTDEYALRTFENMFLPRKGSMLYPW